jgi:hypothetical protein
VLIVVVPLQVVLAGKSSPTGGACEALCCCSVMGGEVRLQVVFADGGEVTPFVVTFERPAFERGRVYGSGGRSIRSLFLDGHGPSQEGEVGSFCITSSIRHAGRDRTDGGCSS